MASTGAAPAAGGRAAQMQVDRVPAGMDAMDEDGLEAMYLERMKESFLRAPDWAESSQKIEQPKDGGEAVNFGKYTPRRVATRDVVEPDYGGYVRRQGLTQLNMMMDVNFHEIPFLGHDQAPGADPFPADSRRKKTPHARGHRSEKEPDRAAKKSKGKGSAAHHKHNPTPWELQQQRDLQLQQQRQHAVQAPHPTQSSAHTSSRASKTRDRSARLELHNAEVPVKIPYRQKKDPAASKPARTRKPTSIDRLAAADKRSQGPVGNELSWYATETKSALAAYDRALRGKGLPPNHQNDPTGATTRPDDDAADKQHVFRIWVGGEVKSNSPNAHHLERQQILQQQARRKKLLDAGQEDDTSGTDRSRSSRSHANSQSFARNREAGTVTERILGYVPSAKLDGTINLKKVKAKVDTGSRTKTAKKPQKPIKTTAPKPALSAPSAAAAAGAKRPKKPSKPAARSKIDTGITGIKKTARAKVDTGRSKPAKAKEPIRPYYNSNPPLAAGALSGKVEHLTHAMARSNVLDVQPDFISRNMDAVAVKGRSTASAARRPAVKTPPTLKGLGYARSRTRDETPTKSLYAPTASYNARRTISRKLDLSNAVPKVDTGRKSRHTPGGGKTQIPLGRMPKKNIAA